MITKSPTRYLLGIDVGNSKTHALISNLSGNIIGFSEIGCGSYEAIGQEGFIKALQVVTQKAIDSANIESSDICGMGFGIAGYDWPTEKPIMDAGIKALGLNIPYAYVNDAVIGLLAGSVEGWGIAVDAGTGNNVRGRDKAGREGRITGNGIWFGEFGGAAELVWRAAVMATYAWSQRGPKTQLTQMFIDQTKANTEDELIELFAMHQLRPSPVLAKEIFRLAAEGDKIAIEVVNWNAKELGLNVNAVIRQLQIQDQTFEVVLIGSIFNVGEAYISPLSNTIHHFAPKAILKRLTVPPVVGAVLLAAETIGLIPGQIREDLIKSTELYLTNIE